MFETTTERFPTSDPLAHDRTFPATCARCGGRLLEPAAYCPHCGVNVRQAVNERARAKRPDTATAFASASAASASAAISLGELQGLPRPTLLFESPERYLDGNMRSPLHNALRFWNVKPNTAFTAFAFLVLFGASTALQRYESAAALDRHDLETMQTVVQGSVIAEGAGNDSSPVTPAQSPALARNSTPAPRATQTASTPSPPRTPAAAASAPSTAVAAIPPSPAPSPAPSDAAHGDRRSRLLSLALARAHDGLDKNDLRKARSGVFWALSLQRDNSEALALKQELLAREKTHSGT
jgi:hypothetical protein